MTQKFCRIVSNSAGLEQYLHIGIFLYRYKANPTKALLTYLILIIYSLYRHKHFVPIKATSICFWTYSRLMCTEQTYIISHIVNLCNKYMHELYFNISFKKCIASQVSSQLYKHIQKKIIIKISNLKNYDSYQK